MKLAIFSLTLLNSTILFCASSYAALGLNPYGPEFKPQNDSVVQITNMPRIRSQDTIGLCYAFVASTMIDEANCVTEKEANCGSVPDNKKASPLDMSRFGQNLNKTPEEIKACVQQAKTPEAKEICNKEASVDDSDRFNYEGIPDGGSEAYAIWNAGFRAQSIVKESCAPFDQVVGKMKDPHEAQQTELAMWNKFKSSFESYKKQAKGCEQCALEFATATAKDMKQNYGLKASNEDILKAFGEESYAKFLDKILIPDECWDLKNQMRLKGSWKLNTFPEAGQSANYTSSIAKIKEVLSQKRPLSLGFCTQTPLVAKKIADCGEKSKSGVLEKSDSHAVVIKGYRRVCNSANQCYDALQVQNSWGESWQSANDDGWVDAKELLNRSFYQAQSMTWLTQKQ